MLLKRPDTVSFDPANKEHRAAVRAFLKRGAWIDSPLRFNHDPAYGSVAEQVQNKLLHWYVAQEEARVVKKPTRQQQPKMGDKRPIFAMRDIASEYQS